MVRGITYRPCENNAGWLRVSAMRYGEADAEKIFSGNAVRVLTDAWS
jgi:hypothetical protein